MTRRAGLLVVDASAVVAALGQTPAVGDWAAAELMGARLAAPQLMPFEAAGALRRLERAGILTADESTAAHHDLRTLVFDIWSHERLADRAWELRHTVTYGDACYVALAEMLGAPLLTLDLKLANAPGPRCTIRTPPEGL